MDRLSISSFLAYPSYKLLQMVQFFDSACTMRLSAVVNHILPKLQNFGYIFVADTVGTASRSEVYRFGLNEAK